MVGAPDEHAEGLEAAYDAAAAQWPQVALPRESFVAYVRARGDDLETLRTSDLYLACACVEGRAAAVHAFDEHCVAGIDQVLGHMQLPAATVDEIKQAVRTKLLLADGERPPRLREYAGRGDLRRWVGVVATREALSSLRRKPDAAGDDALMAVASPSAGPELGYLKEHYRDAFVEAFSAALQDLTPKARNALRQHYLHGLSVDQIGTLYGVHRSNAARRVAKAREALLAGTRRRLVHGLRVARDDFESIMRLIESRIDVSIRRMLDSDDE